MSQIDKKLTQMVEIAINHMGDVFYDTDSEKAEEDLMNRVTESLKKALQSAYELGVKTRNECEVTTILANGEAVTLLAKESVYSPEYPGIQIGIKGPITSKPVFENNDMFLMLEYAPNEDGNPSTLQVRLWHSDCDCDPIFVEPVTNCSKCAAYKEEKNIDLR